MDEISKSIQNRYLQIQNNILDSFEKGKKVAIGTISNGYKKVAEGDWRKVSDSHGMTKDEHRQSQFNAIKEMGDAAEANDDARLRDAEEREKLHYKMSIKLDNKQYSDDKGTLVKKKKMLPTL